MSHKSKICIIGPSVNTDYIGGVATHVKNLKSLLCFYDAEVVDLGSAHCNSRTHILQIIRNIVRLRRRFNGAEYSHVFVNTSIYLTSFVKLLLILAFLPTREGMQVHVFFHGGRFPSMSQLGTRITNALIYPVLKTVTKFHFLSEVQKKGFQQLFEKAQAGLYANYATTDEICAKHDADDKNVLRMLFVGRIVREKGVFELLSALEILCMENTTNIKLTVVGTGDELQLLIEQSEKLPHGMVVFTGYLEGTMLENAYQNADVLILPTYHPEGFPYVFIEAMRAGLPVIATPEGALETIIQEGINGFKVLAKDSDSVVKAIQKFTNDRELLQQMTVNSYEYFLKHLCRTAAEEYYTTLLVSKSEL